MALFGDERYQWRETFFVLFEEQDRPTADAVADAFADESRLETVDVRADSDGRLESITLRAPDDCSAMDITLVAGDEVAEQVEQLLRDLARTTLSEEERSKLDRLGVCNARFDVFHFEELQGINESDDNLDPGSLLIVLDQLGSLCNGIGIDPQSGSLLP